MDHRERTFAAEVGARLDYLVNEGFLRSVASSSEDAKTRPRSLTVSYRSGDVTVGASLVLGFMGEDCVVTEVQSTAGRYEFGPTPAHKGHEMRKALDGHAREIAKVLPRRLSATESD